MLWDLSLAAGNALLWADAVADGETMRRVGPGAKVEREGLRAQFDRLRGA